MNYINAISSIPLDIVFEGYSLQYTTYIILSSSDTSKTVPLCSFKSQSNKFTEISGTPYYNFSIVSNNLINITLKNIMHQLESSYFHLILFYILMEL